MFWSSIAYIAISDWSNVISLLTVLAFILVAVFIVSIVTMKDASVSLSELIFHMCMAVFTFFTNLSLRFPNIDEVVLNRDHSECFFPEINALQHLGILLVMCDKDGGHLLLCFASVFSAWISFITLRWNKPDSNENETMSSEIGMKIIPKCMMVISVLLTFVSIYCCLDSFLFFIITTFSTGIRVNELFDFLLNYSKRIDFYFVDNYGEDIFLLCCLFLDILASLVALTCIYSNRRLLLFVPFVIEIWNNLSKLYFTELSVLERRNDVFKNTRIVSKEDTIKNSDNCPICLQIMTSSRITSCGHVFHSKCLGLCLQQNSFCPLCRTDFRAHKIKVN